VTPFSVEIPDRAAVEVPDDEACGTYVFTPFEVVVLSEEELVPVREFDVDGDRGV
jgi:hypothetical protein